jgi:hypothetical protein
MAIVDPGPFCEVDFEFDYDITEFSRSLDPEESLSYNAQSRRSAAKCQ